RSADTGRGSGARTCRGIPDSFVVRRFGQRCEPRAPWNAAHGVAEERSGEHRTAMKAGNPPRRLEAEGLVDTVLIVDDSLTVRMDLKEAFEDAGFQTIVCASAAAARQAFADAATCIAVLDVLLPDGNGVELLTELRASANTSGVVVLMLSTEAEVTDRLRGLRTG